VFQNVGGSGFPFQAVKGASIPVGCVGPTAKCLYGDSFAFVGSARDEAVGVYIAGSGSATRISSRAIDDELAKVTDPADIILENRTSRAERRLFVHLPDKTLVFLMNASKILGEPVWYVAQSGSGEPYRIRNAVICYGKTYVGDASGNLIGELSDTVSTHFGDPAEWRFDVGLLYNQAKGGIVNSIELVGLPGTGSLWRSRHGVAVDDQGRPELQCRARNPDGIARTDRLEASVASARQLPQLARLQVPRLFAAMPGFAACEANVTPLAA
jgi:hypothetical protein